MKKMVVVLAMACFLVFISAFSEAATLNLKALWTANTETDLAGYNLYRTDGTRTKINTGLIGIIYGTALNPYLFSVAVTDGTEGTLRYKLTAVDTAGNESLDSNEAPYTYDLKAPLAPTGFGIFKQ